jgi:hypothetical protein
LLARFNNHQLLLRQIPFSELCLRDVLGRARERERERERARPGRIIIKALLNTSRIFPEHKFSRLRIHLVSLAQHLLCLLCTLKTSTIVPPAKQQGTLWNGPRTTWPRQYVSYLPDANVDMQCMRRQSSCEWCALHAFGGPHEDYLTMECASDTIKLPNKIRRRQRANLSHPGLTMITSQRLRTKFVGVGELTCCRTWPLRLLFLLGDVAAPG